MKWTPLKPKEGVRVLNGGSSTIPPRSIVVVVTVQTEEETDTQEAMTFTVVEQFSWQNGNIMVTGTAPITPNGFGRAFYDPFLFVSIDTDIDPPKVGEQWGPHKDKWTITRGGMGFYCHGYDETNGYPGRALFLRGKPFAHCRLAGGLSAPSAPGALTTVTVDVWHPDPAGSERCSPVWR